MRSSGFPAVALLLILSASTLQVWSAEDIYWEGELDESKEFLDVNENTGLGHHFTRLKRDIWDWLSPPTTTAPPDDFDSITEDTYNGIENLEEKEDENGISEGSGFPDRVESDYKEKTVRATFVVMEPYSKEYSSRDSVQFQNFSKSLADAVNLLYEGLPGTHRASLVRIQSRISDEFSCKVTLDIMTTYEDTNRIAQILQDHIRDRMSLGNIKVSVDGFKAVDIDPETIDECAPDELKCDDGSCIPGTTRCDGRMDCPDGRDELGCPYDSEDRDFDQTGQNLNETEIPSEPLEGENHLRGDDLDETEDRNEDTDIPIDSKCPGDEFRCDLTRCITSAQVCDGRSDCFDGTDEASCNERCGVGDFRCPSNNMCIKSSSRCDRVFDCPNKEDEQNCACTDDEFKCANDGSCIELRKRCDGVNNCDDSSDEADCASACPPDMYSCPGPELHCVQRCNYIPECPGGEDEFDCEECNHKCDGRCLEDSLICNSYPDCSDGSDELNCDTCDTAHDFRCQNGECLNIEQRCNGLVECDDSSDEENCTETITAVPHTCAEDQFECDNRICIDKSFHCDGNYDCADNSDELHCECGEGYFKCQSGQCIPQRRYCDGYNDCDDGSDENDCGPEPEPETEPNPVTERNPDLEPNTDRYPDRNPLPVEPYPPDYNPLPVEPYPPYPFPDTTPSPFLLPIYTTTTRSPPIYTTRGPYTNTPGYRPDFRPGYPESDESLKLKTYPSEQTIRKGGDVVFTCRDEGPLRAQVRWARQDGRPLPSDSIDRRGRLELYHVTERDSGVYVCQAPSYMPRDDAQIAVTLNIVADQENEELRPFTACEAYEATCGNGQCIPKSAVCDGKIDCSDKSDEDSCNLGGKCEPNTFQCANRKCVLKTWLCDSEDDCGDGSDEDNCGQSQYGDACRPVEFACHNNSQCVPKSFHCDGQSDCLDKSDEIGCTPVYVTMPPKPANLRLQIGETLTLRCTAVGMPTPLISWRLNWGHVPEKCTTTNNNGDGTLTCPDMQIEDRGAYSCEAINNRGSSFAQPDAIVFVEGGPTSDVCPRGYFNSEAQSESDCIQCFCFGESTQCHSADLFIYNMPTPLGQGGTKLVGVAQTYNGDIQLDTQPINDRYYYQPLMNGATVIKIENYGARGSNSHPYLTLPESYNDNQLTSYGGYIRYKLSPHYQAYDNYNSGVPDIIIKGKYVTLVYTRRPDNAREVKIEARLVPGDWQKASSSGLTQATREDIMMSLDQIEMVLLRADSNDAGVNITDFVMESAQSINSGLGAASLVEECVCPPGYGGLSCQKCLDGYVRDGSSNWLGNCVPEPKECPPGTYGDPARGNACRPCPCPLTNRENQFARTCSLGPRGVVCDCQVGYEGDHCERCAPGYEGNPMIRGDSCRPARRDYCNRAGTEQVLPNGECVCKPNVQGRYCDQCAANSFHLSADNSLGCTQCFCTAETNKCTSSSLRRKKTTASFNVPSIVDEVRLYNSAPVGLAGVVRYNAPVETTIQPRLYQGSIYAEVDLSKPTVYYWSMPAIFGGDKLTSYGGYLTYILRNVPTNYNPGDTADVQLISENHLKFNYFGNFAPSGDGILNATVRITEEGWQRTDGKEVSRPHFLLALADVKTILIKATYANQMASIVSASIDTAEPNGGGPQAVEVEQCACPVGFIGTSCEDCAPGYTRSSIHRGLYLEKCEPCYCNNNSRNCHPETGVCYDCADNTAGDKCERCRFGYERDAYLNCVPSRQQPQCECDPRGTLAPCDPSSPYCSCKQNVEGDRCDRCRAGTFGLDEAHPRGCSPCYCSGVTSDCHAGSQYSRIAIPAPVIGEDYGGFRLMSLNDDVPISKQYVPAVDQSELMYIFSGGPPEQDLYWSLPDFSGNRLLSYGGNLDYKMKYETGGYPEQVESHDNVVLVGEHRSLSWTSPEPMFSGQTAVFKVPLREDVWVSMDSGAPVSRHEFMDVLRNVRRVLVKATVSDNIASTSIADVSMDTATDKFALDARPATDIEICMCPEGHTGTSCETCSSGYYADEQGYCQRCRCNGFECQLTSSGEVACNCPPQFTGPDCSTVVDETTTPMPEPSTEPPPPPPPTLVVEISHPTIRILEVGSSVNFTCRARSRMTASRIPVMWSKVDGYLPLGRSVVDSTSGVLIITNLQISDSGVYRCQANDGVNTQTAEVTVKVPGNPMVAPVVQIEPSVQEVNVGERVQLLCAASGNPTPTISWLRAGNRALPVGFMTYGDYLIIDNAQEDDSGEYRCVATNLAGFRDAIAMVTIHPRSGPSEPPGKLSVSTTSPNVFEGQSTRVVCTGTANIPPGAIGWTRQDGTTFESNVRSENGVLYIDVARLTNEGVYVCQAAAPDTPPVPVLVTVQALTPTVEPTTNITVPVTSLSIPTGETGSVDCIPSGYPLPVISWTKYNEEMGSSTTQRDNTLIIANAQESDAGYYLCNGLVDGEPKKSVYVYVSIEKREIPTVEIYPKEPEHTVRIDSVYELQCRVSGNPEPVITWHRSDNRPLTQNTQIIDDNRILRFEKVDVNDEGEYTCTAENSAGSRNASALIRVRSIPVITITPQEFIEVVYGEPVTAECRASGYPLPMVSIRLLNGYTDLVPPSPGIAALRIRSSKESDEGIYLCKATNGADEITNTFEVRVNRGDGGERPDEGNNNYPTEGPPGSNGPITLIALVGQDASMKCDTNDGSEIRWRRMDQQLPNKAMEIGNELIIPNASKSDTGTYACVLINRYTGEQKMVTTELRVVAAPSTRLVPPNKTWNPGQSPSVECQVEGDDIRSITWRSVGKQMSRRAEVRDNFLIFHDIQPEDAGIYECIAISDYGNATGTAEVFVNDRTLPPARNRNEQRARVGSTVRLNCDVPVTATVTAPRAEWSKDGRPLPPSVRRMADNTLVINYAKQQDSGRYLCIIRDNYGRKLVNYIDLYIDGTRPEAESLIAIDNPPRAYAVGEDLTLTCRASSRDTSISWEKLGTNEYVQTRDYSGGSVLVINGVQEADAGVYRCTGRNGYRESFYDYRLEVQPASGGGSSYPDNDNEVRTISARLRDSIDLPCMHDLPGPVAYEWRREPTGLPAELRNDEQTLHLENISENDAGTYMCRVTGAGNNNRYASAQARIVLHVKAVVPQFGGDSWLALPAIKDAYRQFNVEISFKPTDYNGLLLYNSENRGRSGDYIALRLVNGVPQFIMKTTMAPDGRGAVPVVVYGDRPLELNVWHTARINRIDSKVSMAIDNTGLFANESREQWEVLDLNQPLYMGGVPDYEQLPEELARSTGFVGCVSMLILGKEEKNIMLDSTEQYQVSDCDNCAPNPCINNGICQEARNELGYICLCPAGFPGRNCDRTGESCRAGLCGEGKCTDTADGYKCSCPITFTGKNCEHQQYIEFPAFTGSAFLAIKAPKPGRMLRVSMKIKPSAPVTDGIIMYCAESPLGLGGFTSLTVRDGRLEFRYDVGDGTGPAIVTAERKLAANEISEVHISRLGPNVTMKINSVEEINSTLASRDKALNLDTPMFVGGVDDSITLNRNIGVMGGFYGCIIDVKVYGNLVDLVNSSIMSANVQDCSNYDRGDIPESESICKLCRNGGECTPDGGACRCRSGFAGRYCELQQSAAEPCANQPCRNGGTCRPSRDPRANYTCDCPLHYTGPQCNQPLELLYSLGLNGNGYLELPASLLQYNQVEEAPAVIAMAFNTRDDGLLFYQRETETDTYTGDYLMIRVEDGFVTLDWNVGSGSTKLRQDSVYVNDGNRHSLVAILNHDNTVSLQVDGLAKNGSSVGISSYMNADSNIYIGGMPSVYNVYSYHGFTGCIEQIELNSEHNRQLNLGTEAVAGKNIQQCTN